MSKSDLDHDFEAVPTGEYQILTDELQATIKTQAILSRIANSLEQISEHLETVANVARMRS